MRIFKTIRHFNSASCRYFNTRPKNTIADLQAAFRDPDSPFYIPPGGKGPASPDDAPEIQESSPTIAQPESVRSEDPYEVLLRDGLDPLSFWEQKIAWGDQDSFQHVNNVRYARFFESSRIKWMASLAEEMGGAQKVEDMLKGRGVSLILKSIEVQFRRPVTYPDTLLIGYKPIIPCPEKKGRVHRASLPVTAQAYSVAQQAFVAHSSEVLVWYDYDKLRKCDPGDRARDIINGRIQKYLALKQ